MGEEGRGKGPIALEYETAERPGKRPAWVYGVMGVYGVLLLGVFSVPMWVVLAGDGSADAITGFFMLALLIGGILLMGASLMVIPVGAKLRRPVTKRTIWIPILGSSLLVGLLVVSALVATGDAYGVANEPDWTLVGVATAACWVFWVAVLGGLTIARGPQTAGRWLYRMLLTANLLELLVAVPMHLVARRRTECCAGIASAMAIGVGAVVAIVVIGPVMFWLFYRRWEKVRQKRG